MAEGKNFEIGAIIKLDGEQQFKAAVSAVNSNIRGLNADMRKLKEEYAGNENSLEALRKKQKLYSDILEAQSEKIKKTKEGLDNAKKAQKDFSESLEDAKKKLSDAEKELNRLKETSGTSADAIEEQQKEVDRLTNALKKGAENSQKMNARVADWEAKLKSAEAELEKTKNKQKENNTYLEEASRSADKCAKSIDGYGKKVKETTEATIEWGEALKAGVAGKAVDAAVDALSNLGAATAGAAVELEKAENQIEASTELSGKALEQYKDVLESVYANNYGENLEDVSLTISKITQSMGELDNADLQNVTESAIALQDTFDMDLEETLRGAKNLMYQFGLSADEAFDLLGSGAKAGLNYTDELGDNVSEYAGNFAQAGYSATEYFQLLKNGTENGSYNLDKVNDAINEVTNKLADGSVEKSLSIYSTETQSLFRAWQTGGATQKQVIDSIVGDINNCTNQQDALTMAATAFGTMGEDSNLKFVQSLTSMGDSFDDVRGKMNGIKNIKYDDLNSQITEISRSIEMKLGEKLEKLLPVAKNGLELVEKHLNLVISGVTGLGTAILLNKMFKANFFVSAIKGVASLAKGLGAATIAQKLLNLTTAAMPWGAMAVAIGGVTAVLLGLTLASGDNKTAAQLQADEVKRLADETDNLKEKVRESKTAFEEAKDGVESEYGALQVMSDRLYELAGTEGMSNEKKAEMKMLTDQLNESIPDLNLTLNEQTGELNKGKEAIDGYIESLERKALYDTFGDRITEISTQIANANLAISEAEIKKTGATKAIIDLEDQRNKILEDNEEINDAVSLQIEEINQQINTRKDTQKEANRVIEENTDIVAQNEEELDMLAGAMTNLQGSTDGATGAMQQMGESASQMTEAQSEAIEAIKAKYEELRLSIEQNVEGSITAYEKFNGGTKITSEEVLGNLDTQIAGLTNWRDNMIILANATGSGMSEEFLSYLTDLGPEGANLVQALVDSLENKDGDFEGICQRWLEAMKLKKGTAEVISDATSELASSVGGMEAAAASGGKTVYGAFKDAFDETTNLASQAGGQATDAFVLSLLDLVTAAGNYGMQIPESLAGGIADGSVKPEQAMAQIDALVQARAGELSLIMAELGIDMTNEMKGGIESGGANAIAAVQAMNQEIQKKQEEMAKESGKKGEQASESTAAGINSQAGTVSGASGSVMQGAVTTAGSYGESFKIVGYNMMSGLAIGLNSGSGLVYDKVRHILNQARIEAEKINDQKSPSKVWRNKIGRMMSEGMALGIADGQKSASTQAVELARVTLQATKDELEIKSPSGVFKKKIGKQIAAGVAFGIKDNANVAGEEAKKLSKQVYDAANKWISEYHKSKNREKGLQGLENEKYLWEQTLKHLKKGTDAYKDAEKKITESKKKIADRKQDIKNKQDFGLSGSGLDMYKTYKEVSAKAEIEYWDIVRKQFKVGTAERIEADQKWMDARESYYEKMSELEEEYQEKSRETNEKLAEDVKNLTEEYENALKDRKETLRSAFGMFDGFESTSVGKDQILANVESQETGFALWAEALKILAGRKELDTQYFSEIQERGPEALADILALNEMSDEELARFNQSLKNRDKIIQEQAEKELKNIRDDTEEKIRLKKEQAQKELDAYEKEYQTASAKLEKEIGNRLKNIAKKATKLGEEATAGVLKGLQKKAMDQEAKQALKHTKKEIVDNLASLQKSGNKVGKDTLEGIFAGMGNKIKIQKGAKSIVGQIEAELKKAAGIQSPSKRFRDAIGIQIPAGIAEGMEDGTKKAAKAGTDMIQEMLAKAKEQAEEQQAALSKDLSDINGGARITALNALVETPVVQNPVVTVNNTEVAGIVSQMAGFLQEMRQEMQNLKVVLDTGTLVGEISPDVGNNLAAITRRLR